MQNPKNGLLGFYVNYSNTPGQLFREGQYELGNESNLIRTVLNFKISLNTDFQCSETPSLRRVKQFTKLVGAQVLETKHLRITKQLSGELTSAPCNFLLSRVGCSCFALVSFCVLVSPRDFLGQGPSLAQLRCPCATGQLQVPLPSVI